MRRTVVGYRYQGHRLCDTCMRPPALAGAASAGAATLWGDCGTSDDIVGEWATMLGIDQNLVDTDTGPDEFPARVFEDQAHTDCTPINRCVDRCDECGNALGYACPHYPEVTIT